MKSYQQVIGEIQELISDLDPESACEVYLKLTGIDIEFREDGNFHETFETEFETDDE